MEICDNTGKWDDSAVNFVKAHYRELVLHMVAHSEQKKSGNRIAEDVACGRQPSIFRYKKQRRQHYTPRSSHQQHHDQCGGGAVEERCA